MSLSRVSPEFRKLLEIAGTLEHHEKEEHKLFAEVCEKLSELETFCSKQGEEDVYGPIAKEAKDVCAKLHKHMERYKNMTPEKEKEIEKK